jgi:sialic acid synthase SpsE
MSMDCEEFASLTHNIRTTEASLGDGKKKPTKGEIKNKYFASRGAVAKINISKGAIIDKNMIAFLRPARGIGPDDIGLIIGSRAKSNIKSGEPIFRKDIEKKNTKRR